MIGKRGKVAKAAAKPKKTAVKAKPAKAALAKPVLRPVKSPAKVAAKASAAKARPAKKPAATKAATPPRKMAPRADLGAPVDGFFARQPAHLRPILDDLRALVREAAPEASSALKWGMPFYSVGKQTVCALAGFKAHVNLILPGPPGTFPDPAGRLEGDGKTGRHLKLRSAADLPRVEVRKWLAIAAQRARSGD